MISTTAIIINDYPVDRRTQIVFTAEDFETITDNWENTDILLQGLQHTDQFAGRERWCDLEPTHWRVMIVQNLARVSLLPLEETTNSENPNVKSLHFLITGLVHCLQLRSESKIELMHINRISDTEVVYDYTACLNMAVDYMKPKFGLKIVVDNT